MHNINTIYFFIFVFSILVLLKNMTKFVGHLLQNSPQPMVLNNNELMILGLSISYIITYIFSK